VFRSVDIWWSADDGGKLIPPALVAAMLLCGAALQAPAPISPALFESRKCSILGMGLFGKNGFRPEATMRQASKFAKPNHVFFLSVFIRVHPWLNFLFSQVFDIGNGTVSQKSKFVRNKENRLLE
jgi:hypothetical protein